MSIAFLNVISQYMVIIINLCMLISFFNITLPLKNKYGPI